MQDRSDKTHALCGTRIVPGLLVFTNDCRWGKVLHDSLSDGWYNVEYPDGTGGIYNGERMTTTPAKELTSAEEREAAAAAFDSPGAPPF